ncbi:hypothetical protein JP75_00400 [Devosia riboflavina]|uniref:Uncharacterized protein n=1 Tax=Devosia riboflavina TaxID=46914 RepID=A0A087M703_9HYPH|nr:hypothetical protein [Devosia riboflavina]KFL32656.1 hypothetical protein JP75_00400 [Devosia riboflavina]
MFGYRIEARLAGQIRERWEAQKTWPFLTDDDLQSITTPEDLIDLVRMRKGITTSAAADLVNAWIVGYRSRLVLARSGGGAFAVPDTPSREDDAMAISYPLRPPRPNHFEPVAPPSERPHASAARKGVELGGKAGEIPDTSALIGPRPERSA